LPICFIFAGEECAHQYKDDGNCTTPTTCSTCGEVAFVKESHKLDRVVSYTFDESNMLLGGSKVVACSNTGCAYKETRDVYPLVKPLGYAIKEGDEIATLIASYSLNAIELDNYSKLTSKEIEYGLLCYIPSRLGKDVPLKPDGKADVTVIKLELTGYTGINDLAIPKIPLKSYDEEIVFCAYLIIDKNVYYIQGDELISNHTLLNSVSCNDVLSALENK
jgi:hypothetical protein